jgi:riboflavin synthase
MFTGIIEETGTVREIISRGNSCTLKVGAKTVLEDMKLGDSISVNGVCLTVTEITSSTFSADISLETLRISNLKSLRSGDLVNLERSLKLTDRLGGHLVLGHVDGTGQILSKQVKENTIFLTISAPEELLCYIVPKGSIAVDGISLTVIQTSSNGFSVAIVPFTAAKTTLGFKKVGDTVNLETDILGRYVEKLLQGRPESKRRSIDLAFLAEHGFLDGGP